MVPKPEKLHAAFVDLYKIEDARVVCETPKAIRVNVPLLGRDVWIPKSVIHKTSTISGDEDGIRGPGDLIVETWFVEQRGWKVEPYRSIVVSSKVHDGEPYLDGTDLRIAHCAGLSQSEVENRQKLLLTVREWGAIQDWLSSKEGRRATAARKNGGSKSIKQMTKIAKKHPIDDLEPF